MIHIKQYSNFINSHDYSHNSVLQQSFQKKKLLFRHNHEISSIISFVKISMEIYALNKAVGSEARKNIFYPLFSSHKDLNFQLYFMNMDIKSHKIEFMNYGSFQARRKQW